MVQALTPYVLKNRKNNIIMNEDKREGVTNYIYFIQDISIKKGLIFDCIKIGRSTTAGINRVEKHIGDGHTFLAAIVGGSAEEKRLHAAFAEWKDSISHPGEIEWFYTEGVISWLTELMKNESFVLLTPDNLHNRISKMHCMPYPMWRPGSLQNLPHVGIFKEEIEAIRREEIERDCWETHEREISLIGKVLGHIDVDPASNMSAFNRFSRVGYPIKLVYNAQMNGLVRHWSADGTERGPKSNGYCFPPFGNEVSTGGSSGAQAFMAKWIEEIRLGHIGNWIFSLPDTSKSTLWFKKLIDKFEELCQGSFVEATTFSRPKAYLPGRGLCNSPMGGVIFFYYGNEKQKFIDVFSEICIVPNIYINWDNEA